MKPIDYIVGISILIGGLYSLIKLIISEQRNKQLEKENEYLKQRKDALEDALRQMK